MTGSPMAAAGAAPTRSAKPTEERPLRPATDLAAYLKSYAKEHPDVAALWCFGVGFVVGWKLKPW